MVEEAPVTQSPTWKSPAGLEVDEEVVELEDVVDSVDVEDVDADDDELVVDDDAPVVDAGPETVGPLLPHPARLVAATSAVAKPIAVCFPMSVLPDVPVTAGQGYRRVTGGIGSHRAAEVWAS
ncbi:hypothetical protein GCM10027579_20520 [Calidifontibacter terrae]